MIAVIILSVLFILSVLVIIVSIKNYDEIFSAIGIIIILIICVALPISLVSGKSIYKNDNTKLIMEKEQIEYLLENNISIYVIEQAREYNREVDYGNNLWCRFSIEDRNDYKIDIDNYLNKESKNDK